jgi:hypothetical protein
MKVALLPAAALMLAAAAALVGTAAGTFSDLAQVGGNTFSTADCFPTWWWNTSYLYRRQVTVTTGAASVSGGYSVMATLDHAALVSAGKSQADGDDIRVLYWNAGACGWAELDRALDQNSSWNSSSTKIWYKLQAGIAASSFDSNYYLYYGYTGAASPPADESSVYLYWDDFESYAVGVAPTGWTVISGDYSIVDDGGNKVLRSIGSTSGRHVIYRNAIAEANICVSSGVRTNDVTNVNMGPAARATGTIESNSNYYSFHFRRTDNSNHLAKVVNGTWTSIASTPQTVSNNTWYRYDIGAAGSTLKGWFNGTQQLSSTDTALPGAGSVGVYSVYGTADSGDTIDEDNFIARLFVDPEPALTLGAEQLKP